MLRSSTSFVVGSRAAARWFTSGISSAGGSGSSSRGFRFSACPSRLGCLCEYRRRTPNAPRSRHCSGLTGGCPAAEKPHLLSEHSSLRPPGGRRCPPSFAAPSASFSPKFVHACLPAFRSLRARSFRECDLPAYQKQRWPRALQICETESRDTVTSATAYFIDRTFP